MMCLRIRVMDLDLDKLSLTVRSGKGDKDRTTMLSPKMVETLKHLIQDAIAIQKEDNKIGVWPSLPYSLNRKYPQCFSPPILDVYLPRHHDLPASNYRSALPTSSAPNSGRQNSTTSSTSRRRTE